MGVPKAAMNENCQSKAPDDDVWLSRQVSNVQSEAIARAMEDTSNRKFRRRVLASDASHMSTALLRGEWIQALALYSVPISH
jgi:hypothetical protein